MFNLAFGLGGLVILLLFFLSIFIILVPIYYMAQILLSEKLPTDKKILWFVAIFVFPLLGLFIFFMSNDYRRMKGYRVSN